MIPAPPEAGRRGRPRWLAWAGFLVGIALLLGAAFVVFSNPRAIQDLVARLREAPWWVVAFILTAPLLNWVLVSACHWMLLRRHGKVGLVEMNALVGSAWLLNHLPLRPGLVGRVGYHKLVNGIRVRDAIGCTVWSLALAGVSGMMGLGLALALAPDAGVWAAALVLAGPAVLIGLLAIGCGVLGRDRWAWLLGALSVRYADVAVWAVRYAAVFTLMGIKMTPVQVVGVTGVSLVAQLVPTFGGGLGVREWCVGLAAGAMGLSFDDALAADLVNRAAETLVVVPVGLLCGAWVARRVARVRRDRAASAGVGEGIA